MTPAARQDDAMVWGAALAPTVDATGAVIGAGGLRRAAAVAGDLLGTVAIVVCIPFVILAIGIPIALGIRLALWIGGLL